MVGQELSTSCNISIQPSITVPSFKSDCILSIELCLNLGTTIRTRLMILCNKRPILALMMSDASIYAGLSMSEIGLECKVGGTGILF